MREAGEELILPVYLTVDTEVGCPLYPNWRERGLNAEIDRDIYGRTPAGDFGMLYQMKELDRHGLRANFFVETLFSETSGQAPLREILGHFHGRRHDAQLHLHVEWLTRTLPPAVGPSTQNLGLYSEEDQVRIIGRALAHLRACGGPAANAFRAGNYAADVSTMRALARNGFSFDTSQNAAYPISFPGRPGLPLDPWEMDGVTELPVSFFEDWPGHYRPAQICACSSEEMEYALNEAHRQGRRSFVIVWHSFELTKRQTGELDSLVLRRFQRLCRFLEKNSRRFQTQVFSEAVAPDMRTRCEPIRSNPLRTLARLRQQALSRW